MANLFETVEGIVLITDNELLGKYLYQDDPLAFEELVRRHSGLVMGVCRNMLLHSHDAEDAFQVTFLVLSRKSKSLINHGSIAGWLYQTALRNCLQIRRRKGRAREIEMIEEPAGVEEPWMKISKTQEYDLIYQEINRLPKHYRDVIVLCHLQGQSRMEAAEFLALTESSVKAALARGRNLLRRRLIRNGLITSTALAMLSAATSNAKESIPEPLIESTLLHCQGNPPVVSVGNGPQFVQTLSHHGALSMQSATIIKSIFLAASFAVMVSIPLVLIAQKTEVGNSERSIVASLDSNQSDQSDRETKPETVEIANQSYRSSLTPSEGLADYLKQTVGVRGANTPPERNDDSRPVAVTAPSDHLAIGDAGQLDSFSKNDSKAYWELMLKSYTTRARALETSSNKSGNSQGERLLLVSERYEMEAKAIEAELNLRRIKAATANQAKPVDLTVDPMSGIPSNPNSALKAGTVQGIVTNVSDLAEFVAINIGSDSDIRNGQEIDIFRKQQYIARAQILHTLPKLATAKIVATAMTQKVRVGDRIMIRIPDADGRPGSKSHTSQMVETADEDSLPSFASPTDSATARIIPPASTDAVEPGETLLVESFADKSLDRRVVVRADHTISMPLIGTVSVKGATTEEIKEILDEKFSRFVKTPRIFVVRENASTPLDRARK